MGKYFINRRLCFHPSHKCFILGHNNLNLINVTLLFLSISPITAWIIVLTALLAGISVPLKEKDTKLEKFIQKYGLKTKASLVTVVLVCILSLWNEHNNNREKQKQDKESEDLRQSLKSLSSENTFITVNLKQMGIDYRNGQFFPVTRVARELISEMNKSKAPEATFALNFNSPVIKKYILGHTSLRYARESPLIIKVGYSGRIAEDLNGLHYYPAGYLTIEIDQLQRKMITDIELTQTYPRGARESAIQQDLQAQLEAHIQNQPQKIAKYILKCLN
ncbi:hypothetical protein FFJ24_005630 [Pedobacter sp. KBS0701]|uniref:hypothetical protein n=1 Tax=Pedobacter sp. KBS0701 TaxID=2578106 RepID=UPI00110DB821|nr:hypothetical protein [Pedobacter sp. KBS0701]QDW24331.1 hypothetical protein FFJ24_005630 [Pedobacter sp. KBS0701]